MKPHKLFHVSELPNIKIFKPLPSPSFFDKIKNNVVFAISDEMLHNYLLPRSCPRVTFYASSNTSQEDVEKFLGNTTAKYVVAIESGWSPRIQTTTLYCYEFPVKQFMLLDECAGYYISYKEVRPKSVKVIDNILKELLKRNIELRFMPIISNLADKVKSSTLNFSLIRLKNAK